MTDWRQRVVLISPFFYPELISTGKANQHLAEDCAAEGHEVTAICSHPMYPDWQPVRSRAALPGIDILRGGGWLRYPKAMPLRRLLLEAWFACYAMRRAWPLRKKVDVAISVLPPSLFAFFLNSLLPARVRRVAVIHDLQGVLAAQEKSFLRKIIIRLIHAVERRAFRSQDLCIFFSGDMARVAQDSYGLDPARVAVQYPCITLRENKASGGDSAALRRLETRMPPDRLHVVYSGALGYKQNSERMVAFLQAGAERHPEVGFHVLSGGPFFDALKRQYEVLPGPRVQFQPLVPEQDLEELYARSAIQIVPQAEGTEAAALPSKLPNLLAAGVHLLAICTAESEVGRLIQRAGTGSIVERWDEALFLTRLEEALASVRSESAAVRRSRVAPLLQQFSVHNLVRLAVGGAPDREPDSGPRVETGRELAETGSGARG